MAGIPPVPGAAPGSGGTPPAAQPATPPAGQGDRPAAPAPETLTFTREALDQRLEQASRTAVAKTLKALGFDSEDALKAFKTQSDETAKAAKDAERAKMDEATRLKAERDEAAAKRTEAETARKVAEEAAEAARTEAHLITLFAQKGIKDFDIAFALIERKLATLGDGEDLDEAAFLDELVRDPHKAYALGVATTPPAGPAPTRTPATTTTSSGAQPPPPAPNAPPVQKHVKDMTPAEWEAYKAALMQGRRP